VLAETNECQQQNEESDGQQPDHFALVARPLPRLQLELSLLWAQRIHGAWPIAHNPILRVTSD